MSAELSGKASLSGVTPEDAARFCEISRRALIDGGADWAAEAFSDMAEKAASGPMSASVLPERESQREGHDVSRKRGDGKPQGSA